MNITLPGSFAPPAVLLQGVQTALSHE